MIPALFGQKKEQSQRFLEDGIRIPVTSVQMNGTVVVSMKTMDTDGYWALKIASTTTKKAKRTQRGKGKTAPHFLREIRLEDALEGVPEKGSILKVSDVFKPGDIVDVVGVSKGKGYAGVVKRHHFKGGPRTHGQSDRERAPGSIGQTTTPGRVYRGKRMAGHMGANRVTVRNLQVMDVLEETLLIKGLVPGSINTLLMVTKVGEAKKFTPLYKEAVAEEAEVEKGEGQQ